MAENRYKEKDLSKPIENHKTAAWANIEKLKDVSRVPIPDISQVQDAREWVNKNQK